MIACWDVIGSSVTDISWHAPCSCGLDATDQSGRNPAFLPLIDGVFHATGAVLGLGAHDLEFAHGVAGLAPSGDGIKDDFYGGRSHLSELQIASRLSFNSIRLGLEEIFCCLQLPDQRFDFRNRCRSNLPNKWRDIRVSLGLRRRRRLRERNRGFRFRVP